LYTEIEIEIEIEIKVEIEEVEFKKIPARFSLIGRARELD